MRIHVISEGLIITTSIHKVKMFQTYSKKYLINWKCI